MGAYATGAAYYVSDTLIPQFNVTHHLTKCMMSLSAVEQVARSQTEAKLVDAEWDQLQHADSAAELQRHVRMLEAFLANERGKCDAHHRAQHHTRHSPSSHRKARTQAKKE